MLDAKCMVRVTFVPEAGRQVHKQITKLVYLAVTVRENADHTAETNMRVLLANLRFRRYSLPLFDQLNAPLRLQVWMIEVAVMENMLYRCVTWSPASAHLAILRTAHHRLLLR